jgi:hypothetical protein
MSVKFKLAPRASKKNVARLLDALADEGLKADQMFPGQTRPALKRMYVIRSPKADVKKVKKVLDSVEATVEYVEASVTRKTMVS